MASSGGIQINWAPVKRAFKQAAVKIGNEVAKAYKTAIREFYASYTPGSGPFHYSRTYSLYKGAMGVGGSRDVNYRYLGVLSYECGINVGAEYYEGNPYYKDPEHGWPNSICTNENIFTRSFDRGIHGFNTRSIWTTNKRRKKLRRYGSTIEDWKVGTVPHNSSETPRHMMNMLFKELDNQGYVDGVIDSYMPPIDEIII